MASCAVEDKKAASDIGNKTGHPINHWIQEGSWPKEYFELEINMSSPLARKKSSATLRREVLESSSITPSQKTEGKSAPYKDLAYETLLAEQGSFLDKFHQGITDDSKDECQILLNTEQAVPQDSLFRDDLFDEACAKLRDRNEARVINDFARLIVPSAETLATYGAIHLKHLIVGMNERWNESIPVTDTHPQPDFCVGFKRSAFTQDQLKRLEPFTGNVLAVTKSCSLFLATWRMYFPFFTCEAKCGSGGLDIADRQNAHSMTLAVKGIVELFKIVKREKELHRRILSFSISHDDEAVRIYGHYPIIDGDKTTFYRHTIKKFDFTSEEGKEKWTAYKFTKNVYDVWMPTHLKRICSAIDDIPPDLDFGVSLGDSFTSVASAENESELPDSQEMTTSAPASQDTERMKKPRLTATAMLREQLAQRDQQLAQRDQQLMESLKQQTPSNASSGNESMLQQEIDRLREQMAQRDEQFMHLLKQQTPSNASATESELQREHDRQQQEIERQKHQIDEQKQENKENKQEMKELKEQIKELMNMLKQRTI